MQFTKRQIEIIVNSIKNVAEHGLEALTTKNISQLIGISEALYRHFESKNHNLLGVLDLLEELVMSSLNTFNRIARKSLQKIYTFLEKRSQNFIQNTARVVLALSEEIFPHDSILSVTWDYGFKLYKIVQKGQ
jgi:hypothetical protein